MPDRLQAQKLALASREAANWFVALREGNVKVGSRRRYVRWLKQSPVHIGEMLRLSRLEGLLRNTELNVRSEVSDTR